MGKKIPDIEHGGRCFANVSLALQNFVSKSVYRNNPTSYENIKLKFQLEILVLEIMELILVVPLEQPPPHEYIFSSGTYIF